ncbi:hypothetical protein EXIGLDRAFT_498645 [Exidia glandulosa HHB12029]|uniref:Alpha-ketoglutarate-dependent dioxygenase AlkB-like domain-containing protein n=1 Tax=Exidia glandulosa HHB12029 TaxID=1314781 RepID=A0A165JFF6_EXIGL|nr:hypothetical protein EXIGLDRAFT_498645 [Exidia glandulosa HHB12029]
MNYHSDFERGLGNDVAALSLGSPAQMRFKYRPPKPKPGQEKTKDRVVLEFTLNHGDVLIMHGLGVQENYQHMVSPEGFRIAATARWIDRTANELEPTARPRGYRGKKVAPADVFTGAVPNPLFGATEFDAGAAASVDAALAIEVPPSPVPIASPQPEAGGHTVHTYSPGAYADAVEEFALPLHDTAAADDFALSFDHAADELGYLFGRDWMPRQAWTAWETTDQFSGPSNEESSATPRMAWEMPDQLGDEGMRSIADIRAMSP